MERLTRRSDSGHAYSPRCFAEPCNGEGCELKDCPFDETICEHLAAYEDTELTPVEVTALIKDWIRLCMTIRECGGIDRLRELAEADKDGRMVVLCGGISMTNADFIRDMNDEDLARFLDEVQRQECEALHEIRPDGSLVFNSCQYGWLLWLKKEAKKDG